MHSPSLLWLGLLASAEPALLAAQALDTLPESPPEPRRPPMPQPSAGGTERWPSAASRP